MRNTGRAAGLILVLTLLSAQACLSFDTYCQEKTDCEDGNEEDKEACIVREEAGAERADLYGCTDELEAFVECREKDSSCENNQFVLLNNDCNDENREYASCIGDNLPPTPF